MHRPDGGVMPIAGFWRKRTAVRWAQQHEEPDFHLEVQRYDWWLTGAWQRRTDRFRGDAGTPALAFNQR
ncbi:hypothetical protein B7435_01905 [Mycolicibacterium peregrinum]|uniref:hypothetical protein n=1 Tax=Mycolicibacterium peregrinum TaxID=43304 RepID=UPI0006D8393C|nr:hypothetical protein [Mycolicibacterium peregrinum]MCV7202058.1 hypothetical protein [Mycolicibacterium peregrinum]ORW61307.1 hypothetical protein AWC21_08360 [Mycolicibacterium peregrinum]OWM11887.1 hypothetical protein B7435_01905 [Mycolicibacterium peregrinum]